jgi:molecular chaperone GrpE
MTEQPNETPEVATDEVAPTVPAEQYNTLLQAYADADNQIKRLEKSRQEAVRYAVQSFARDLLDVADSLEQAMAFAQNPDASRESLQGGLDTMQRCLLQVFERHGISAIRPAGEPFDPYLHEAVAQVPVTDAAQANSVLHVMQVGYKLDDRLLRIGLGLGYNAPHRAGHCCTNVCG